MRQCRCEYECLTYIYRLAPIHYHYLLLCSFCIWLLQLITSTHAQNQLIEFEQHRYQIVIHPERFYDRSIFHSRKKNVNRRKRMRESMKPMKFVNHFINFSHTPFTYCKLSERIALSKECVRQWCKNNIQQRNHRLFVAISWNFIYFSDMLWRSVKILRSPKKSI